MADKKFVFIVGGIVIYALIAFLTGILVGVSYSTVGLTEVALKQSKYSKSINKNIVYRSGRYQIGLSSKFLKYPLNWKTIIFSSTEPNADSGPITGKTNNPSDISLSINIMYRIKYEFLGQLYTDFPDINVHHTNMMNAAKDQIQKIITTYSNDDFFKKREEISLAMSYNIGKVFKSNYYTELTLFNIDLIALESKFEEAILNQLVNLRQGITAIKKQEIQVLQGQINVVNSTADLEKTKIINEAEKQALIIAAQAQSEGDKLVYEALANGYSGFINPNGLNFTDAELMKFIYIDKLVQLGDQIQIISGFDSQGIYAQF